MFQHIKNKIWQYWVRKAARARGFIDPIALISRIGQFAKPSEVAFPVEVMRIGVVLNARGFVNAQAIQHNLDWVWPFWVSRQFDPTSISFIPRAFSMTHINLTHRNWTAVGLPYRDELPIVDPRGLTTPIYDGWSIDSWVVSETSEDLIPSRIELVKQDWDIKANLAVVTQSENTHHSLISAVRMIERDSGAVCAITLKAQSKINAHLVVSLRPYNPEGVSFINTIGRLKNNEGWRVDGEYNVYLDKPADKYVFSSYTEGDVYRTLFEPSRRQEVNCEVGMATTAAMYTLQANEKKEVTVYVPLEKNQKLNLGNEEGQEDQKWQDSLKNSARLNITDKHFQFLYDASLRTLISHTGVDVYPGPYTYKHFWFRDAAFIHHALMCLGLTDRCARINELFFKRQQFNGYFSSQEGEWDSNGQVLWALQRYCELSNTKPPKQWKEKIEKGVKWILKKRLKKSNTLHSGLLPSGFSAEHLGPNDYYYWDDFWGVAGLKAGANLLDGLNVKNANLYSEEADRFMSAIEESLKTLSEKSMSVAMPSSPYRRMDSASIGSIAVGYPLQLWAKDDSRLIETNDYLLDNCFVENGFFHDMSHSGINPYLTLYVAQVLLRNNDARYYDVMKRVADIASATGQWPEAVHPATLGGCMGDGQHAWASAEWLLMMRNCFVQEEEHLVLASGVHTSWYAGQKAEFGPTLTQWGSVSVTIERVEDKVEVSWDAEWYDKAPNIEVRLPGKEPIFPSVTDKSVKV